MEIFFTQVFRDNLFHADMHPGNIFVSEKNPETPGYIGVDFGIVGNLSPSDQLYLAENFLAFFSKDYRKVVQLHVDSGWVKKDIRVEEFEAAIRTVCEPIFQKKLHEISFGKLLISLFQTVRKFDMQIQPQLILLQKTLLNVEGLGRQLYPQLDLWETAKPLLEKWIRQISGPMTQLKKTREGIKRLAQNLPQLSNALTMCTEWSYTYIEQQKRSSRQQKWVLILACTLAVSLTTNLFFWIIIF